MSAHTTSPRRWRDELPVEHEWPTWLLIAAVYGSWFAVVVYARELGPWPTALLLTLIVCWYGSLQHELLHGHPTRSARLGRPRRAAALDLSGAAHPARPCAGGAGIRHRARLARPRRQTLAR